MAAGASDGEEEEEEEMEVSEDEGSEDEDAESGDGEEEESEEEPLEPKVLPNRSTRAQRIGKLLDDEDSADEEFWGQDFFAEEDKDDEFEASESEQEDVADADFSDSEESDDEDEDAVEARVRREERSRKKTLKPPGAAGAKRPPAARPHSAPKPAADAGEAAAAAAAARAARAAEPAEAPQLRKSTRQRTEDAEREREREQQQRRPRKRRSEAAAARPLTQEELLAEAAYTELENLRSLERMQAAEEEVKKRAAVTRARHTGPFIRHSSKVVDGATVVTCEVANMLLPPHMQRRTAPPPAPRAVCAVTGRPARYRDPLSGQPYADAAAFKALRGLYAPQALPGLSQQLPVGLGQPLAAGAGQLAAGFGQQLLPATDPGRLQRRRTGPGLNGWEWE